MATEQDRVLLEKLAIDNPWSWSTEGLDDCCMFCGADEKSYRGDRTPYYEYLHYADCAWFEAREYLGKSQPEHKRLSTNSPD